MVAAIATATWMMATTTVTAAMTKVTKAVAVAVAVASNGGDSDSRGAQTTTARLSSFQHWLFLHPLLSRGSSSTTTSVPMAAPKRNSLSYKNPEDLDLFELF